MFLSEFDFIKRWQKILKTKNIYKVQLLNGNTIRVDARYHGDAASDFAKYSLYNHMSVKETEEQFKKEMFEKSKEWNWVDSIMYTMRQYWQAAKEEDFDFELPETILGAGGTIKILEKINE